MISEDFVFWKIFFFAPKFFHDGESKDLEELDFDSKYGSNRTMLRCCTKMHLSRGVMLGSSKFMVRCKAGDLLLILKG